MAHSLGGVNCLIIKGIPAGQRETLDVWREAGYDSYAGQKLGLGDADFSLELHTIDTNANINTWIDNIEALQGTLVTLIYDSTDWNETYTNLLITKISPPQKRATIYLGNARVRSWFIINGIQT